jgi:hypothetical protein
VGTAIQAIAVFDGMTAFYPGSLGEECREAGGTTRNLR